MQTRKLYYEDSMLSRFTGRVLSCRPGPKGYEVILDQTAFYPEGGGQAGDTGILGGVRVLDTFEKGEELIHLCREPLEEGTEAEGEIDWDLRFYRMQQHSGEHIVSGLLHQRFGCHNTGFHMGAEVTTIDFDVAIPPEVLPEIEARANAAVYANLPLRIWVPSPEELPTVPYRTKRALPWPVRVVEIPGCDICACCGTHVKATGAIGLIKIFSAVSFRGGTRIEMACGKRALEILNSAYEQNRQVSQAFSVPLEETGEAARRMNALSDQAKYREVGLRRRIYDSLAESCRDRGNVVLFEEDLDGTGLRELAERVAAVCGGWAAVFSGDEETGYSFCLGTQSGDLRSLCREMTGALQGRGGGKPCWQQGRVKAGREEIREFFADK